MAHTLDRLEQFPPVTEIVSGGIRRLLGVGLRPGAPPQILQGFPSLCRWSAPTGLGARRSWTPSNLADWVMVHDGARPGLDRSLLQRGLDGVAQFGAVVAGVPVKDTIQGYCSQRGDNRYAAPGNPLGGANPPDFPLRPAPPGPCPIHRRSNRRRDDGGKPRPSGYECSSAPTKTWKVTTPEDLVVVEAILKGRGGPV